MLSIVDLWDSGCLHLLSCLFTSLIASGSEVEEEVKKKPVAKKKRAAKEPKTKKETKKPKKTKKKKDPNAPKRPLSAFMFYSQKTRPIVKQENPDATFAEVAKILGEQWKALDEKAKKVRTSFFLLNTLYTPHTSNIAPLNKLSHTLIAGVRAATRYRQGPLWEGEGQLREEQQEEEGW